MTMRKRTLVLSAVAALLGTTLVGCADRGAPHLPTQNGISSKDPKRMSIGELQQYASTSAVLAVAETGTSLTQSSTPPPPIGRIEMAAKPNRPEVSQSPHQVAQPVQSSRPVEPQPENMREQFIIAEASRSREGFKIEGIRSSYFQRQDDALRDALSNASQRILEKLRQLDHPIYLSKLPPYEAAKYVVPNSGRVMHLSKEEEEILKESSVPANNIRYQLDIELNDHQVRQLRSEERVRDVLPVVIGIVCLAGVAGLFLRLTGMAASAVRRTVG